MSKTLTPDAEDIVVFVGRYQVPSKDYAAIVNELNTRPPRGRRPTVAEIVSRGDVLHFEDCMGGRHVWQVKDFPAEQLRATIRHVPRAWVQLDDGEWRTVKDKRK